MNRPPTGRELIRTGLLALLVIAVLGLVLVLTSVLSLRTAVSLLVAYTFGVCVVTCARWLQARAERR